LSVESAIARLERAQRVLDADAEPYLPTFCWRPNEFEVRPGDHRDPGFIDRHEVIGLGHLGLISSLIRVLTGLMTRFSRRSFHVLTTTVLAADRARVEYESCRCY